MRILITGGVGYLGSKIALALSNTGHDVFVPYRNTGAYKQIHTVDNIKYYLFGGSTLELVQYFSDVNPDLVIHLASIFIASHSPEDVGNLVETNIQYGLQVLEAMRLSGVKKLINTGSNWQYYQGLQNNPINLYASTKEALDCLIRYYSEVHHINVLTLILGDVYGPNDPRKKIINTLVKSAQLEQSCEIAMSPGNQLLDLIYIDDVVAAYLAAIQLLNAKSVNSETFSISSGQLIPLRALVALIQGISKFPINVKWGSLPYRERENMFPWVGPTLPNWEPLVSLQDGLIKIWNINERI